MASAPFACSRKVLTRPLAVESRPSQWHSKTVSEWELTHRTWQGSDCPTWGRSIVWGRINATRYLFVAGEEIDNEDELLKLYPVYAKRFLLPRKATLSQRTRIDPNRWWRLAER